MTETTGGYFALQRKFFDHPFWEEKRVFSLDNIPFKGIYLGLVGWIEN